MTKSQDPGRRVPSKLTTIVGGRVVDSDGNAADLGANPVMRPLISPPAYLNHAQLEIWSKVVNDAPPDLLKEVDASLVAGWCVACWLHGKAVEDLNSEVADLGAAALIITLENGCDMPNPLLKIIDGQLTIMRSLSNQLGFDPGSRIRNRFTPAPVPLGNNPKTPQTKPGNNKFVGF